MLDIRVGLGFRFIELLAFLRFYREFLDDIAVEQDHQLMRFIEAFDHLVSVSAEPDFKRILSVPEEIMLENGSTTRTERKAGYVSFLGQIGRNHDNAGVRSES